MVPLLNFEQEKWGLDCFPEVAVLQECCMPSTHQKSYMKNPKIL